MLEEKGCDVSLPGFLFKALRPKWFMLDIIVRLYEDMIYHAVFNESKKLMRFWQSLTQL